MNPLKCLLLAVLQWVLCTIAKEKRHRLVNFWKEEFIFYYCVNILPPKSNGFRTVGAIIFHESLG